MVMWLIFGAMAVLAVVFAVKPLLKGWRGLATAVVAGTLALSIALYAAVGSPGTPSGASAPTHDGELADINEVVASLAARLEARPDDLAGWQMLGRSYMQLGNYGEAARAFERAVELESGQNAQMLVELGEAYVAQNNQAMTAREITIFENAVTVDPENQAALFWSGIGASNRGDNELAASRWEKLLHSQPAPSADVAQVLANKIAEWRGAPVATAMAPAEPQTAPVDGISVMLDAVDAARDSVPASAAVFVIARDPAQPSPPIAVKRRLVSELPATVVLTDQDSMVAGRNLSAFPNVEIVARISTSGNPMQQSGDWFGATTVETGAGVQVELLISEQVQ